MNVSIFHLEVRMSKSFTKIPHIFIEMLNNAELSSQEFSFLCLISKHNNIPNGCKSAASYISSAIKVSPNTVCRLRKSLSNKGLITTDIIKHTNHHKLSKNYDKFSRVPNSLFLDMKNNAITRNEFNLLVVISRYHYRVDFCLKVESLLELSNKLNIGVNTTHNTAVSIAQKGYANYEPGSKYNKTKFTLIGTTAWVMLPAKISKNTYVVETTLNKAKSVSEEYKNDCDDLGITMFDCVPDFIKNTGDIH